MNTTCKNIEVIFDRSTPEELVGPEDAGLFKQNWDHSLHSDDPVPDVTQLLRDAITMQEIGALEASSTTKSKKSK